MTLDEAIKHAEEVAYQKDLESGFETDNERYAMTDKERTDCKECAKDFRQLSDWLKELKRLKEQEPCEDAISREQAKVAVRDRFKDLPSRVEINTILNELPSVIPSYNSIKTELKSCDDCISRQAVKEQMIKYGFHAPDTTVTEFVEDLPSVTPQPKTGKWTRANDKT